jgi:hypothetical protein
MTRKDFFKRLVQIGLLALLTLVVFSLKSRIVSGYNCSGCPERGICKGNKECKTIDSGRNE